MVVFRRESSGGAFVEIHWGPTDSGGAWSCDFRLGRPMVADRAFLLTIAGDLPAADYDVTLVSAERADEFAGRLLDLPAANEDRYLWRAAGDSFDSIRLDSAPMRLHVTAAGATKRGTIVLQLLDPGAATNGPAPSRPL